MTNVAWESFNIYKKTQSSTTAINCTPHSKTATVFMNENS